MRNRLFLLFVITVTLFTMHSCKENELSIKLIPVKSGEKWGYIDKQGKIQINPQFNQANIFIDGLALVANSDGKFGFINEEGKYVINPIYKDASFFQDGWALVVSDNSKPQFIDKQGNVKLTVNNVDECGIFCDEFALVKSKSKWGFIDKSGSLKIPAIYDAASCFTEELAPVMIKDKDGNNSWGYINTQGKLEINCQFKEAFHFKNGYAVVSDGKKYGYIGKDGKYIINPQFDDADNFENGFAVIKQGTDYGYIDSKGKIQINPQFKWASKFTSNDLAVVESSDKQMGYIDKSAKYVINPQFEYASKFYSDFAFVSSSNKIGLIGKDGKFIVNPQFDNVNIQEPEHIMLKVLKSDYFDIVSVTQYVSQDFTANSYKNITSNSTFNDLRKLYSDLKDEEISGNSITLQRKNEIGSSVIVQDYKYSFKEDLYSNDPIYKNVSVPNYYSGSYSTEKQFDHFEKIFHNEVPIYSANFKLSLHGNANNKGQILCDALQKELGIKTKTKLIGKDIKVSDAEKRNGEGNFILCGDDMLLLLFYDKSSVNCIILLNKEGISKAKETVESITKSADNSSSTSADNEVNVPSSPSRF